MALNAVMQADFLLLLKQSESYDLIDFYFAVSFQPLIKSQAPEITLGGMVEIYV